MKRISRRHPGWLAPLLSASLAGAQSNQDPGIDGHMRFLFQPELLGRAGTFPDGVNAISASTTVCNLGTSEIPWRAAMDPAHPVLVFLIARELGGRFEQISDRSYVKHVSYALSESSCAPCSPTDGTRLGVGCSDTYDAQMNGNQYGLGPPDEIDPWLGTWSPACSLFDRGEPAAPSPLDCDGVRSFDSAQAFALGPVAHRVQVRDADFAAAGATFWKQCFFLVAGEREAVREDNLGSNALGATWNGSGWVLTGDDLILHGSVLQRWTGASLSSATNGSDDGRVYVAVKVTGPVSGFYHYEYAIHNRDNRRGVGAFRVPTCSAARVRKLGFRDIDADAVNDWSAAVSASEIAFKTAGNPCLWNSIFNFWFDSDAAPAPSVLALDEFFPGPGLASVTVASSAPLGAFNLYAGPGCALGTPPTLFATGAPARATIGNTSFAVASEGNAPGEPAVLYYSLTPGTFLDASGCTLHLGSLGSVRFARTTVSDVNGLATYATPIPSDIALEGARVELQSFSRDPLGGPIYGLWEASDALTVRVGGSIANCP